MAYLALARKWRPKAFSEVVGQQHVVQALSNALDSGRIHHAFLFTGTRGVGKTTLARIFAKSLNCEEGTSAEPCQQCGTCQSIDQGRFVDLIEVDAASRTKVDETRELLENVQYAPTSGKFKVYLIDEVHMFSGHSFNALLKTLEEPPEHVKFLFATTDPQKLPVTVLSRCLQFNLRAMRPEQVENQLVKILSSEGVEFDRSALMEIARAADGSMRDGLSLLDQAIAQGGGEVRDDNVRGMLGTIKSEHIQAIVNALQSRNVDQALNVVAEMAEGAVDFTTAIDELLVALYRISLAQVSSVSINQSDFDDAKLKELASSFNPETLQLYYQIGLISKRDIALSPSLRVGFEMALLRMFAFEPEQALPSTVPGLMSPNTGADPEPESSGANPSADTLAEKTDSLAEKKRPESEPTETGIDESVDQTPSNQAHSDVPNTAAEAEHLGGAVDVAESGEVGETNQINVEKLGQVSAEPAAKVSLDQQGEAHSQYQAQDAAHLDGALESVPPWEDIPPSHDIDRSEPFEPQSAPVQAHQEEPQPPQVHVTQPSSGQLDNTAEASATSSTEIEAISAVAVTLAGNNEWGELIERTQLVGMAKELAMNCSAERINDERIELALSPKLEHLHSEERFNDIQIAVKETVKAATNNDIAVSLELSESDRETPSECLSRLGFERQEQVREQMHNDAGVKSIIAAFGASIKENSIKPLGS